MNISNFLHTFAFVLQNYASKPLETNEIKSYKEDISQIERQKQWLKNYERELYDRFQQMTEQHQNQIEQDARESADRMRKNFEVTDH